MIFQVCEGDLVAAQWQGDEKWYRAKVIKVIQDEYNEQLQKVDLDFVDFGDAETKNKEEVCELKTEFLKLNFQAIKCSLDGVKPM